MSRCVVCSRRPAKTLLTAGRHPYGPACADAECQVLAWEGHFLAISGAPAHDSELLAWQWRKHRAAVLGDAFTEAPPRSPAEVELEAVVMGRGWDDMAREME